MIPKCSRLAWYLFLSLLFACSSPPSSISSDRMVSAPPIEVIFSPHGGATEAVVRKLGNAKKEVFDQAYSFTSAPITKYELWQSTKIFSI
jgi:hypothetical protein